MKKGYLVLQDGQVFEGFRFGGPADAVGELVFTTGMCGYLETLTDPSYAGQIVMQTYPLIGNYGIIPEDFEGACCVRGYVVREWCEEPSNFRCQGDLDAFLRDRGVPGLWGVDTRELQKRGCTVTVLPAQTSAEEVLAAKPDGVMLSNGPGDPAENVYQIEQIKKLLGKVPLFGICLGHQLTALAVGGGTYKLKYGHRGVNQPVRDLDGVRTYITSQNHGYAVDGTSLPVGKVRFINANDGTCEGIDYPDLRAFTVQFHPEACTGPKDTSFLFDQFVALMKGGDR